MTISRPASVHRPGNSVSGKSRAGLTTSEKCEADTGWKHWSVYLLIEHSATISYAAKLDMGV
ncbi:MAG: hypothetical protein D3906_02550 [Candidatus Electrothrix sp. AUS1_2]|nr:hypothetical protein [Candidatus Electrothrix sp. AUS1_2]